MSQSNLEVIHESPSAAEYLALRRDGGLKVFSPGSAARGLARSRFCVTLRANGRPVGMGRVVGDAGSFRQVVDIAASGRLRGRGLGKIILSEISAHIRHHLPPNTYVSLLADGPADGLYRKLGFFVTTPKTIGMALRDRNREGILDMSENT